MKRFLSVVLALGLVAAVFAPVLAAPGAVACAVQYTVLPGDYLSRIGVTFGVSWPQIAAANNLTNPSLIFPGQVLCIPAGPGTPAPTATGSTPAPSATPVATNTPVPTVAPAVTVVIPTFSILSVVKDTSVTIQTANFPANQTFNVTMGPIGSLGVGGTSAGTISSGAGGVFTATANLPAQMAGVQQIAIRLQSASGYYSYNWFWNFTAP